MGLQQVREATLIRHAYVRKAQQGSGIGGRLLDFLVEQSGGPICLTLAHLGPRYVRRRFPTITGMCAEIGLDLARPE